MLFNAMALEAGLPLAEVVGSAFWYCRVSRDFELFADPTIWNAVRQCATRIEQALHTT
jgi:hypothetical protein